MFSYIIQFNSFATLFTCFMNIVFPFWSRKRHISIICNNIYVEYCFYSLQRSLLPVSCMVLLICPQSHHKGKYLLEYVCRQLNLIEKDYFALRYADANKQRVSTERFINHPFYASMFLRFAKSKYVIHEIETLALVKTNKLLPVGPASQLIFQVISAGCLWSWQFNPCERASIFIQLADDKSSNCARQHNLSLSIWPQCQRVLSCRPFASNISHR